MRTGINMSWIKFPLIVFTLALVVYTMYEYKGSTSLLQAYSNLEVGSNMSDAKKLNFLNTYVQATGDLAIVKSLGIDLPENFRFDTDVNMSNPGDNTTRPSQDALHGIMNKNLVFDELTYDLWIPDNPQGKQLIFVMTGVSDWAAEIEGLGIYRIVDKGIRKPDCVIAYIHRYASGNYTQAKLTKTNMNAFISDLISTYQLNGKVNYYGFSQGSYDWQTLGSWYTWNAAFLNDGSPGSNPADICSNLKACFITASDAYNADFKTQIRNTVTGHLVEGQTFFRAVLDCKHTTINQAAVGKSNEETASLGYGTVASGYTTVGDGNYNLNAIDWLLSW